MVVRMESNHISRELCDRAKLSEGSRPLVGECLLLCRVIAVVARDVFLFGPGWEAIPMLPA